MKRKLHFQTILTPLLCLITAASALAQDGPSPKEILVGHKAFSAFPKSVREELKVTDSQFQKMQDAFQGSLTVDGDRIMLQLTGSADIGQMEKDCLKALDEAQQKRLTEIWIQRIGAAATLDVQVAKTLAITPEQSSKIDKIAEKYGADLLDMMMSGSHDDESAKKAQGIRDAASKEIGTLLTAEQKKSLDDMKGKPFKLKKDG